MADDSLYIWHAYFGIAGCNNDVTVLDSFLIIHKIGDAKWPVPYKYTTCNVARNKLHWILHGIYPKNYSLGY